MNFQRFTLILLTAVLLSLCSSDAMSQRTSRERAKEAAQMGMEDRINYEIKPGNITIGNYFDISLKGNVGYKPHKRISFGLGAKSNYSVSLISSGSQLGFGGFAYGRFKITESIYLQGEYNVYRWNNSRFVSGKKVLFFPGVGGGYMSGRGEKWSYGFEVLYNIDSFVSRVRPIEYWINFSYKF